MITLSRKIEILCMAALLLLSACEKIAIPNDELTPGYNKVYSAAAARNPNRVTIKMADTVYKLTYGASYGGYATPAADIQVQFAVDKEKAQAFNVANNTQYELLPEGCYQMGQLSSVIPQGGVSTSPLAISINPTKGMELFKEYIVAVTITAVKGEVAINESLQTAYYVVKASLDFSDFPEFDRSGWKVSGVSSEEPAEGEANGGLGLHTIDGKASTFWHTKWDGGFGTPPHWLAVDMGEVKTIHGLNFTGRQSTNNGKPNIVEVAVSDNGTTWTPAGMLTLANTNARQQFFVPSFPQARYFRITVAANYGNVEYTHLAELGAF
ncbi:hypothetical protein HNQ91_002362 [Filimonas zeae]|nr:DUF1735 domain-containing protein [Filimonas zeae]MDR6339311.1 hypothetical protein [Filimonas zeae]